MLPALSETATTLPIGPPPLMRIVRVAASSFIACPSREAAQSVRPSAAQAVGERPWICRARSTLSLAVMTAILTKPSAAVARMI